MTKEECMKLIRSRIEKYENEAISERLRDERNYYVNQLDTWYSGLKRGLLEALEVVGMIDNNKNKTNK